MKKLFYSLGKALSFAALWGIGFTMDAQIRLASIYQNGVVLQQGVPVPVWGKGNTDDTLKITINAQSVDVKTDHTGAFTVNLPATTAGGPYSLVVHSITGKSQDTIKLSDVYYGDVWLVAGQSNMEFTLSQDLNGTATIAAANDQKIREFHIPKGLSKELSNELPDGTKWSAATPATAGGFSAVAYYFAKDLKQKLNIPIGIVKAAYGGARIESFMSEEMLGFDEDFAVLQGGTYQERQPTLIYNKMINPILKFPYKGILWYQGESNGDSMEDAKSYSALFQKMINSWRANMGQGNIPFIFVQLPNQGANTPANWDVWPQLRRGQNQALSLPNTGEVVTIDAGEADIHPKNKKPVGERAALVARDLVYGEDILSSGPRYKSFTKLGAGKTEITFDFVGTGLIALGNTDTVKWFAIAGADNVLKPAKAKITGTNTVEVWSDAVPNPEIIKYAWEYNPEGVNLYNSANLPAVPFYIDINPKPFKLEFTASKTDIERGNSTFLQWTVSGASSIKLNGAAVDSTSGANVYPKETTTYILKAVNKNDPLVTDSISIIVNVQNPQPTVVVTSSKGTTTAPDSMVTLIATAKAPGDGTIASVTFYVNGDSLTRDTEAPYEVNWTPTTVAEYTITAKVIDGFGQSKLSAPFKILVTKLKVMTYEAELAKFTGEATVSNDAAASNGKVLAVKQTWELLFDQVLSPDTRTYQLTIGYSLLPDADEKRQNMTVNGVGQEVYFLRTNNASEQQQVKVDVALKAGVNEILFTSSWGWMNFDYISIAIDADAVIPPSVKLSSDAAPTIAPNTPVTLTANALAPNSTITQVTFFVNGKAITSSTTDKYKAVWIPDMSGEYSVTVKVLDDKGNEGESKPLIINVTDLTVITLEAEDAKLTGDATVGNNALASHGKFVDVKSAWSITFDNVEVPKAGSYELTIGYQLPYQFPKGQNIIVNGGTAKEIMFEAPNNTDWLKLKTNVTLKEGVNTIRFENSWGYMVFDYISFAYEGPVGIRDQTYTNGGLVLHQNYPNPFSDAVNVSFELPSAGPVSLELLNTQGQVMAQQSLGSLAQGAHIAPLDINHLENGLYVMKLIHNNKMVTRTVSVSK